MPPFCGRRLRGRWPVATDRQQGPVERATRAQLRRMGVSVQTEALPAAAVAMAREIDASVAAASVESLLVDGARSRSAASATLQLRMLMAEVAKDAVLPERDGIDELNAQPAVLRVVPDR